MNLTPCPCSAKTPKTLASPATNPDSVMACTFCCKSFNVMRRRYTCRICAEVFFLSNRC